MTCSVQAQPADNLNDNLGERLMSMCWTRSQKQRDASSHVMLLNMLGILADAGSTI
jgi:hypothetical protein